MLKSAESLQLNSGDLIFWVDGRISFCFIQEGVMHVAQMAQGSKHEVTDYLVHGYGVLTKISGKQRCILRRPNVICEC